MRGMRMMSCMARVVRKKMPGSMVAVVRGGCFGGGCGVVESIEEALLPFEGDALEFQRALSIGQKRDMPVDWFLGC